MEPERTEPVTLVVTGRSLHQSALLYRGKGRMKNGKWRPIPKSAPPHLSRRHPNLIPSRAVSGRTMRVTSAHPAKGPPSSLQPPALSVNDVYKMAERTRMRTSKESREVVVATTQKMVRSDSGMSRPLTSLSSRGYGQGGWFEGSSPSPIPVRRRVKVVDGEGEDSGEDASPGFVSNVRISRKPRSAPILHDYNHHQHDHDDHISTATSDYHDKRINSALTVASTYRSSAMSCVSPRPSEPEARKLSVSRQCCEVLGPGVCPDCQRLRVRMMDRERMEAEFPRLRVNEKNVTTSAVVMRIFPDMAPAEIQDKIARGEIDRNGLQFPPRRAHYSDDSDDDEDEKGDDSRLRLNGLQVHINRKDNDHSNDSDGGSSSSGSSSSIRRSRRRGPENMDGRPKLRGSNAALGNTDSAVSATNPLVLLSKVKLKLGGQASTPLFFLNLKHMNSKIFNGSVDKTQKPPVQGRKEEQKSAHSSSSNRLSVSNPNYMAFISPRKSKMIEEPAYKVYFEPPLLAKHRQVSTPSFFAGSDNPYCLPERLPEVLEFADGNLSITDPNALRSESSMSFVSNSAPSEEGPELSHRGDVPRNTRALLQASVQQ